MSLIIFGDLFSFPDGLAATNRIYTYAKGFQEQGITVHVICFANNYMKEPNGVVDGIFYYNPFEQKERSKYFIARRWHKLMKYKRTRAIVKRINRKDKVVAVNRWSDTVSTQLFGWILAKSVKAKVITECNEHPLRYYQKGWLNRKTGIIKFYIDSYFSSGILCISRYLIDFHKKRNIAGNKLFLVPSTVDPSRFTESGAKPVDSFYVGYFGSLTFKRDNIDLLLNAFALFSPSHPQVKLVLGGFCSAEERERIKDLIGQLNIGSKTDMIEYLSRQEIIKYITHADILVMVRARDLESDASYPSKLTEFLATGKPVVSVNVGEIADFLKDEENSFLVNPGDVEGLAKKLDYIINNYEHSKNVAAKGRELTSGVFNYRVQAKRILEYTYTLYK